MRIVILVVGLLIIGFLVMTQLGNQPPEADTANIDSSAPRAPTQTQDLGEFAGRMDEYMLDSAERRNEEIDKRSR